MIPTQTYGTLECGGLHIPCSFPLTAKSSHLAHTALANSCFGAWSGGALDDKVKLWCQKGMMTRDCVLCNLRELVEIGEKNEASYCRKNMLTTGASTCLQQVNHVTRQLCVMWISLLVCKLCGTPLYHCCAFVIGTGRPGLMSQCCLL